MGLKNIGLGLHFLLELAALAAVAYWGFRMHSSWGLKILLGVGLPVLAAAAWGIFRVPNDPGEAIVAIPGVLRLALEWVVMGGAVLALYAAGRHTLAWVFLGAVVVDYLIMLDRVISLLNR